MKRDWRGKPDKGSIDDCWGRNIDEGSLMKNLLTQGEFLEENRRLMTETYKVEKVDSDMRLENQG